MKIIENNILPPRGYKAITLGPLIFVRKGTVLSDRDVKTDGRSYWDRVYYSLSMEREAYAHQDDLNYIKSRKHFAWIGYIM